MFFWEEKKFPGHFLSKTVIASIEALENLEDQLLQHVLNLAANPNRFSNAKPPLNRRFDCPYSGQRLKKLSWWKIRS